MSNNFKDHLVFSNGQRMPIVGLGTWQSTKEEIQTAISTALEIGYRHFDCAYSYMNEGAIGEVLNEWITNGKVKREELFIVTKLPMIGMRKELVEKFIKKSLAALQLDYLDLYLVHHPIGLMGNGNDLDAFPLKPDGTFDVDMTTDLIEIWQAMENQVDAGLTRSIGISNFSEDQINRIVKSARIKPSNLQVELHAQFQQKSLRDCCERHGITICAYAPLGSPGRKDLYARMGLNDPAPDLLTHPVVTKIAKSHKKSNAQILLRYVAQLGIAVIPKSVSPERIRNNFEILDFSLSVVEMAKLRELDQGEAGRTFNFATLLKGTERHPENNHTRQQVDLAV